LSGKPMTTASKGPSTIDFRKLELNIIVTSRLFSLFSGFYGKSSGLLLQFGIFSARTWPMPPINLAI
jgi:hypothetical protein